MAKTRYLTKSRFKLALECPTKLFYTGKSNYANQNLEDSFLLALADGGYQVGELAKCYFPAGHDIKTLEYEKALSETNGLLQLDTVTIYEAAIATDTFFIRADILVKEGNKLHLYEVKAKSFDSKASNPFTTKSGTIRSQWSSYLYDVAFQKHVLQLAYPEYEVSAHLMLADKSARCPTDGLNQKFLLVKDDTGHKSVCISESLTEKDLTPPILCTVNVDDECRMIFNGTDAASDSTLSFSERAALFARQYAADRKIASPISSKCAKCEFYTTEHEEKSGLLSGKKECWKEQLGWDEEDFSDPTVLDVWAFRGKDSLIEAGVIKMADIAESNILPKSDDKPGLSSSQRQWLQIEKVKKGDNSPWVDTGNLSREMNSWVFPLHFIDFETTMAAIPFNAGRRPYEGVAFQFSHHLVHEDGTVEHAGQYLNTEQGVFPNYDFVRALKIQLEGDSGTIFRYAAHENTYLNIIYQQLQDDQRSISDKEDLCSFLKTITKSTNKASEQWIGERNMVDMCEIVKRYYYDPC